MESAAAPFVAPSGRELYAPDLAVLQKIAEGNCLSWLSQPCVSPPGELAPGMLLSIGGRILRIARNLRDRDQLCFIGVSPLGDLFAKAAARVSVKNPSLIFPQAISLTMAEVKNGLLGQRSLILVETAIQTEQSVLKALNDLSEAGFDTKAALEAGKLAYMIFIKQRGVALHKIKEGGIEVPIQFLYFLDDIVSALAHMRARQEGRTSI